MTDYTDLPLKQLTILLTERSLATDGTKDMLISRLEAYDAMNDTSPSLELHTPVLLETPVHKPTLAGSAHFTSDIEKEYELNWDEYAHVDPEAVRAAKAATVESYEAESDSSSKSKSKSEPKLGPKPELATSITAARGSSSTSKSNSNILDLAETITIVDDDDDNSSQGSISFSLASYDPTEKVTKSGFKYKSLAASLFPDSPKVSKKVTANVPLNTPSNVPSKTSKAPPSDASTDTLSKSPPATSSEGLPKALPAMATKAVTAPVSTFNPNKNTPIKSTIETVKTTKSGFKFNSIASLFSTPTKDPVADPIKPPTTQSQSAPKPTQNMLSTPIYASGSKLSDKDEEAKKLALRAKRFGITPKEENEAATKLRRQARFGPLDVVDDEKGEKEKKSRKEKEQIRLQQIETEKEKEREKVRQRVTSSSKRQRQEDGDRRQDRQTHKRSRQDSYYSPNSTYHGRRRY